MASTSKSSESAPLESHLPISCNICEKKFSTESNKRRHMRNVHSTDDSKEKSFDSAPLESHLPFSCNMCGKKVSTATNKRRHMRNVHKIDDSKAKLKCSECLNFFVSHSSFVNHITQSHPEINIKKEIFQFPDANSFELWKRELEKKTASKYLLKNKYKSKKGTFMKYYNCHRSGFFTSHSKGVRRLKAGGSYKINSYCPSRIMTMASHVQENYKIVVAEYYSTHIGHECDNSYIRLSKSEKDNINCLKNGSELPAEIPIDDYSGASDRGDDYSYSNDSGEDLEIVTDTHLEQKRREENALAVEMIKESNNLEKLKEDLKSIVLDFLPLIENIEKEKTCKKMLASLTSLKRTCEAIESQDEHLPSIVARNASTTKKRPQRKYPEKKKRAFVKKTNHTQDDVVLQKVLLYSLTT